MKYLSAEEAAKKWRVSIRSVQRHCEEGHVEGAKKFTGAWMFFILAIGEWVNKKCRKIECLFCTFYASFAIINVRRGIAICFVMQQIIALTARFRDV